MFCTSKEQETCDVEKRGCEGCYYSSLDTIKYLKKLCNNFYNGDVILGEWDIDEIRNIMELYNNEKKENKYLHEQLDEQQEKVNRLSYAIDGIEDRYYDACLEIDRLEAELGAFYIDENNMIYDLGNFKRQLEIQNLMSKPLEEFIENYIRFSNKGV